MKRTNIFLLLAILAFYSCAVMKSPDGGPPDTTPPDIIECSLQNRTINFKDKTIEITFNKYMNNSKVLEGAFIAPKAEMEFDWSGKTLELSFPKGLDTNTAYILTFGADFSDYYGVKPEKSLTFVFSTGNKIDSGAISGKLLDENPSGNYIYAYKIDNINPDTLNPAKFPAKYLTQIGSSGEFKLQALPDGKYRLFAVKDELKDGLINERDAFSCANYDVSVDSGKANRDVALKINKPFDFNGAVIYFVEPTNANSFKVNFSDNIDSSNIAYDSVFVIDSIANKRISPIFASISKSSPKVLEYYLSEDLDTSKTYKIEFKKNSIKTIYGLSLQDTGLRHNIKPIINADSTPAKIISAPFADSSKSVYIDKELKFAFSKHFKYSDKKNFKLINKSKADTVILKFKQVSNSLILQNNLLESNSDYLLIAELKELIDFNNIKFKDTTVKLNFKTEDKREWGSLGFTLKDEIERDINHIVILKNVEKNRTFTIPIKHLEKKIIELPAGSYQITAFADRNNDGIYSYGSIFPFTFSERFVISQQALKIKSRWAVEDFTIEFKE